jgi:hypothetical protein
VAITKGELFGQILELEKRRSVLLGRQERPGYFKIAVLGLGLSGGLLSVALLGWLLALPIRAHALTFALSTTALAFCGFGSALLIHVAKPRLSPAEAEELDRLDRELAELRATADR